MNNKDHQVGQLTTADVAQQSPLIKRLALLTNDPTYSTTVLHPSKTALYEDF